MLDKIEAGPDSFKHFMDDVMHWANALITSAEALHNVLHFPPPSKLPTSNLASDHPEGPASRDREAIQKDTLKSCTSVTSSVAKTSHTKQVTLSFARVAPTGTMQPFPKVQRPPMNRMRFGVLPFVPITSEEAEAQLKREFAAVRKDSAAMKRDERKLKEKRIDEKRALAVRRQKECRDRKKKKEISSGLRDSSGRRVKKTVNKTVSLY